jgi:hypothetical protein
LHQSLIPSFLRIHTAHDETQERSDLDHNRRACDKTTDSSSKSIMSVSDRALQILFLCLECNIAFSDGIRRLSRNLGNH